MRARAIRASLAEKEVERLFKIILPKSPFKNKAFAVGGYVRDELLGIDSKDLDVVVEMRGGAEKLTKWINREFKPYTSRPHQLGAGYPIWSITFKDDVEHKGKTYKTKGAVIEFADSQKESFPDPDSRQRVTEPGSLKDDVERRDFTVNMLLKDLSSGELKDLTGTSVIDIKKGVLRGHPGVDFNKILRDDPLRMMRLVRFQSKYGWQVPIGVLRAVKKNAQRINIVSAERIQGELVKLMKIGKLHQGIRMMKALGLLKHVLPEIEAMRGVEHDTSRGHHQEGDVYKHTMLVLKNAKPGVENQLAALLHDVGKPNTQEILEDKIQFLGHETVGAEMAEAIMRRLKFEKSVITKVRSMVENHMRPHSLSGDDVSAKALRKFVRKVGEEMVDSILDLAEADQLGNLPPTNLIPELRQKIQDSMKIPISKKPVLDGRTIMNLLNIKPGKMVGEAMNFLKEKEDEYAERGIELTKNEAMRLLMEAF
jgi:poly(A) polymerase